MRPVRPIGFILLAVLCVPLLLSSARAAVCPCAACDYGDWPPATPIKSAPMPIWEFSAGEIVTAELGVLYEAVVWTRTDLLVTVAVEVTYRWPTRIGPVAAWDQDVLVIPLEPFARDGACTGWRAAFAVPASPPTPARGAGVPTGPAYAWSTRLIIRKPHGPAGRLDFASTWTPIPQLRDLQHRAHALQLDDYARLQRVTAAAP